MKMMLNHADSRIMSNSIECFVTNPCVVPSMPEPLFEMDSNAFSVVNPPVAKGWEQNFESFRDYKHFPLVCRQVLAKTYHGLTFSSFKTKVAISVKIRHHFVGIREEITIHQKHQRIQYYIHNGIHPNRIIIPSPYIQRPTWCKIMDQIQHLGWVTPRWV